MPDLKGPDYYRGSHGKKYEDPSETEGFTVIKILEFLWGLPWGEIPLCFIKAVNPTYLRVTNGEVKTDAICGRVTVWLDRNDRIESIDQEVKVSGGCGYEMENRLNDLRKQYKKKPIPGIGAHESVEG